MSSRQPVTRRLRFWLAMLELAVRIRAPRWLYLWFVGRASNAADWGEPEPLPAADDRPF